MPFKKRHYSNEIKKPASPASYVTGAVGTAALLLCALMIYASAGSAGNTPMIFSFIGIISMLATLICMVYGFRQFKDDTHSTESRWLGFLAPLFGFLAWISIYVYGMMTG